MNKLKNIFYILGLSIMIILPSCSEPDDEITSIDYDRLFSPTELTAKIVNKTGIRLTWNENKQAESYNIEVFANGDLNFEGTPVLSLSDITEIPYIIEGLEGETSYSIRVQCVSSSIASSKWASVAIETEAEQIFSSIAEDDLKATEVTLRWPAGQTATEIVITPGDITHTVTASEIAEGAATITGLTGETEYTAKLMNGTKTRGTLTFTTLVDLGDATGVYPEDDLRAILDAAADGDSFVLFPGEYILGDYTITKAISIAGYKPSDKPVVYGRFLNGSTLSSFTLKSLILDGTPKIDGESKKTHVFEVIAGCNLQSLEISGCEIKNYTRGLLYNNASGTTLGSVTISDCIVTNIDGDGGDGIDVRTGSLASLTVENSTFNTGFRSFLRVQTTSNIVIRNCTFYQLCMIDSSNNTGLFRSSSGGTFSVSDCLFVATGKANPSNASVGNWCKSGNMKATATYSKNYYYNCNNLWVGQYTSPSACDATEADPQFKDAGNGDFTVQNIDVTAGDPRWLE